jgi:hypothetical protein
VLVVVTDDQIQDASEVANARFQKLRTSLLASSSDVMRFTWTGPHKTKDFTVMVFTNTFPDQATRLPNERQGQVEKERTAGSGGSGGAGSGSGKGTSAATPSPSLSPSPSPETSGGFWPPPWWFWAVLAAAVAALILLTRKKGGVRLRVDGTPARLSPGEKPLEVRTAGGEAIGDLRLRGGGVVFTPRAGWTVEKPERILEPGRNGAWASYDVEATREAPRATSWSDAPPAATAQKAVCRVEVAKLTAEEGARTGRPPRTGTKGGGA